MINLYDSLDGVLFSLWVPGGTRRTDASSAEVTFVVDADGDPLELVVELVRGRELRSIAQQVAFWANLGDDIRRAASLVDGYLVTSVGNSELNVVRQLRLGDRALHCWAHVRRRPETLPARIVWVESICSSLVIS